jgi:chromosome segregation ATPase
MPPASSQPSSSAERRKSLESKLAAEQRALDDARKELAEQEAVRYGDERNYQRVLDRLQPYKERVEHHQEMVDSIQRELSNLR